LGWSGGIPTAPNRLPGHRAVTGTETAVTTWHGRPAGSCSPGSTSASRSTPLGQAMVPATGVYRGAGEQLRVGRRLEHAATPLHDPGEVELADEPVREGGGAGVFAQGFDAEDSGRTAHHYRATAGARWAAGVPGLGPAAKLAVNSSR
jgi:hypothetical protein